jgi:CheY-like chemotaxis protein
VTDAERPDSSSAADTPTVLVLDDQAPVRHMIRRVLESGGLRVLEAADGEEGLALLENLEPPPDVVLTDIAMPKIDGLAVYHALSARRRSIRVLGMSGSLPFTADGRGDRRHLRILPKPVTNESLLEEVRALCAQARAERGRGDKIRQRIRELQDRTLATQAQAASLVETARELQRRARSGDHASPLA